MKKILGLLTMMVLVGYTSSFATLVVHRVTAKPDKAPANLVYELHTRNTVSANDTFATQGDYNIYGPYNLVRATGDPAPTVGQVWADIITGTSPTMAVEYQLIPSFNINDTISGGWTPVDTISGAASLQAFTITGIGSAIVFKVTNYDGTACQIPGALRVGIKDAKTVTITK